jgi:diguanylate cyclase (GGDEF)-like protein
LRALLSGWPERALLAAVLVVAPLLLVGMHQTIKVSEQRVIEAAGAKASEAAAQHALGTRGLLLGAGMLGLTMLTIQAIVVAMLRRNLARRYEQMTKIDALTGLPNRVAIEDILTERLAQPDCGNGECGVLLVDIDDFKNINDSLGHAAGDEVLCVIAHRMRDSLGEDDVVARYSGDEFIVLTRKAGTAQHLSAVAAKLLEAATPVISVQGNDLFVTLSIGIASYPFDGTDVPTLLRHADAAMYRAKENGRNGFQFFAAEMNDAAMEKLQMSSSLRHGLKRNEFLVHYQPKTDSRTGQLVGFEALVRWDHPKHGILPPGRFIRHAENSGAIEPLGEWVLRAALAQARAWSSMGFAGNMAVNLSMRQLYNRELPAMVRRALTEYGIDPKRLELEVTESMVSHNPELAARTLGELHNMGVSIAIDDFGTGQSSLAYLLRFPFSTLKIDRTFIAEVPLSTDACAIVRAIIALGRSLRLKLVAEGVESTGQRTFLDKEGCDEIQGYLVSAPLAPHEAVHFLEKQYRQRAELLPASA